MNEQSVNSCAGSVNRRVPTRKERERLARRAEILAVARELFAEKGFHNVSMQEVAARSEFSTGSLYAFFENKDALYHDMMLDLTDDFHQRIALALDEAEDELAGLRAYLAVKAERFQQNAGLLRLYFKESGGLSASIREDLREEMCTRHNRLIERLGAIFQSGIQRGVFQPVAHPRMLALALVSLSTAVQLDGFGIGPDDTIPKDPDSVLNVLFKGLLA